MLAALVFPIVVGAVPLFVLTRRLISVPFAGAVLLIASSLGATLATWLGISVVRTTLVLMVALNVVAAWVAHRLRSTNGDAGRRSRDLGDLGLVVWFTIPALALLLVRPPDPIGWDARSIWWFHASWFRGGGDLVRESLANPLLSFSQPSYPAGNPASIATLWAITGTREDLVVAQSLTAVLSGLAIASLALVLVHHHRAVGPIGAATLLVAVATHHAQGLAAAGYVDVLAAASLVTALSAYLCLREPRLSLSLGSVALAAAAVSKNEGFAFGVVVLVLAIGATDHGRLRTAAWGMLALIPAVLWRLVVQLHLAEPIPTSAPVSRDPQMWERLRVALFAVFRESANVLIPTFVACILLVAAVAIRCRRPNDVPPRSVVPPVTLLGASVLCGIVAALAYALGDYDLAWWFATSLDRVAVTPELFALASLVTMIPIAGALIRPPGPADEATLSLGSVALQEPGSEESGANVAGDDQFSSHSAI